MVCNKFIRRSLGTLLLLVALAHHLGALRTGAPQLACMSLRPLHGLNRCKPASGSQFYLTQSSLSYLPSDNITVEIETASSRERYFRGFIVQAYDPISGAQVGRFVATKEAKPVSGCSAATHRNNLNKNAVALTWVPEGRHQESDPWGTRVASQWLGLTRGGGLSSARSIQPSGALISTGLRKRQLEATASASSSSSSSLSPPPPPPRSVRFRATIVVSYEEFYCGYESTDQKFDKFDFAPTNKPPQAGE